ncbi:hypothetical protein [Nitrospira sp. M1]
MRSKHLCIPLLLFCSCLFASHAMAQNTHGDYCDTHQDDFDEQGRQTLEDHKQMFLDGADWWFDSNTREWKEWPSRNASHSLEEYKDLYLSGPDWWSDSATRAQKWREWPNNSMRETLDCHKKLYLNGPDWWFDSNTQEWKQWPH